MKYLLCLLLSALVFSSDAQEHLTCLRSSSAGPSVSIDDPNRGLQQGAPGKVGPIGQKGKSGVKGEKGDAGVPDNSVVDQLRGKVSSLQQQLQETNYALSALRAGYVELDDGWVALLNGYLYKLTPSRQSYENSKIVCRESGAELAVYGMQDIATRRTLKRALKSNANTWFGMNDIATEGEWKWENGKAATDTTALWHPGQPNTATDDCAYIQYHTNSVLSFDETCTNSYHAICEKENEG